MSATPHTAVPSYVCLIVDDPGVRVRINPDSVAGDTFSSAASAPWHVYLSDRRSAARNRASPRASVTHTRAGSSPSVSLKRHDGGW